MKDISLNFGAIRDSIARYSVKTLVSEGKEVNLMDIFASKIKENPLLKLQFVTFRNIEQSGSFEKERLAERFIQQSFKVFNNIKFKDLINENRDIRIELLQNSHVEPSEKNYKLYESIHTLIESNCSGSNVDVLKENEAYEFLVGYLTSKKLNEGSEKEIPNFKNWRHITKFALNNFEKRYSHLRENEQELIKVLISEEQIKNKFLKDIRSQIKDKINTVINTLNTPKDKEKINVLKEFEEKVDSLQINSKQELDEAIIALSELRQVLNEEF